MLEKLKARWLMWKTEKTYTIKIHLNSCTIDQNKALGDSRKLDGSQYSVRISPCNPEVKAAVLAHELGHCAEGILTGKWDNTCYSTFRKTGKMNIGVLKCEAYAWRFARKMFPELSGPVVRWLYSTYVDKFRDQ
jgi:hypothetical protein